MAKEIMTIDELAKYLRVSKSTLYKHTREGDLPGQKIGKCWRFKKATIDSLTAFGINWL